MASLKAAVLAWLASTVGSQFAPAVPPLPQVAPVAIADPGSPAGSVTAVEPFVEVAQQVQVEPLGQTSPVAAQVPVETIITQPAESFGIAPVSSLGTASVGQVSFAPVAPVGAASVEPVGKPSVTPLGTTPVAAAGISPAAPSGNALAAPLGLAPAAPQVVTPQVAPIGSPLVAQVGSAPVATVDTKVPVSQAAPITPVAPVSNGATLASNPSVTQQGHCPLGNLGNCIRRSVPAVVRDRSLETVTALSMVSSCIVTFAPANSIMRVVIGEATPNEVITLSKPYFLLFAQNYYWALYGMVVHSDVLTQVNTLGTVVCLVYLIVLAEFGSTPEIARQSTKKGIVGKLKQMRNILGVAVLTTALISVLAMSCKDHGLRAELLAYIALCCNIAIFLTPMQNCIEALRTGSTVGFPVALIVASFVSCGLWAQYSALTHNFAYLLPNVLGLICCGIQMCVVAYVHVSHGTFAFSKASQLQEKLRDKTIASYGTAQAQESLPYWPEDKLGSQKDVLLSLGGILVPELTCGTGRANDTRL